MTAGEQTSSDNGRKVPQRTFLAMISGVSVLLDWSGRLIATLCLGFMFVALFVNVVLRYAFGDGIAWAYEIHALLLPWLVAGGIVIAAARGRNIAITLLPDMLTPRALRILQLIIQVSMLAISISVLWSSQPILKAAQFQTLSTLGIKQIWGYASLVYAFAGMAIIAMVDIMRILGSADVMDHSVEHASLS
jgi:TRAP-type C4-dicarboxylate transport system permease small subunit